MPDPLTTDESLDRGMDNYNPAANESYFIGVSSTFSGRVYGDAPHQQPGGTPAISGDILITVNATSYPIPVDHLGNTGGITGRLESLDDRLFAAHIRNSGLWTAHNIAVDASGRGLHRAHVAPRFAGDEFNVPVGVGTRLSMVQSAQFSTAPPRVANARQYWIPSAMVSGGDTPRSA